MNGYIQYAFTVCLFFFIQYTHAQQTPQPFLPEIISKFPCVRDVALSAAGDELYITVQTYHEELSTIVSIRKQNERWMQPQVASFSGKYSDMEPCFSPDGLRLYFVSARPLNNSGDAKDYDIWYVERKNLHEEWSSAKNLGAPVNTTGNEFYPSLSASNNLYFTSDGNGSLGKDDIFMCEWENGKYNNPKNLGDSINGSGYEFNAFIAPDESFLIYTCYNRFGGFGSGDLYISHKKENGGWSAPKNLGKEINSPQMDYCPYVDMKTGMLYFTSKRNNTQAAPKKALEIDELLREFNRYDNGLSRLYIVGIKAWLKGK